MKILTATFLLVTAFSLSAPAQANAKPRSGLTLEQIKQAEQRLSDMGYWTGLIDGRFDAATRSALIAFQKWEGRPVTAQLTLNELEAVRASSSPKAKEIGYEHAEVDLDRQVFLWVVADGRVRVLPASTGTGEQYVDDGQTSVAYTPRGRFLVYDKGVGWENGPLGAVYYPNGISGGIAIHGSLNVANQPASHGCIRIPMFAAREVSKLLKLGTIVLVYDKVSFVSAKDWVRNPKLKEAALANISALDDDNVAAAPTTNSKSTGTRKPRPKIIRE